MPTSFRRHALSCLRHLALCVLVLGLLAKPVLVAACELDDLRLAPGDVPAMVDSGAGGMDDGQCCAGRSCGECCTAVTALLAADPMDPAMPIPLRPQATAWTGSEPAALPAAIRPPIAG